MSYMLRTSLGCLVALGLTAPAAFAGPAPNPPPSGIVIHLFGPNSITSHILPTAPSAGGTSGSSTAAGGTSGTTAGNPGSSSAASDSLTWGDIAHQMFVTGDPSQEGAAALPKGKTGGN